MLNKELRTAEKGWLTYLVLVVGLSYLQNKTKTSKMFTVSRDSSVSIDTKLRAKCPSFNSWKG